MGSNSELHVVLTTKLSLDRKTMYMKMILLDYFPVLLLFCWWFVMYGVDAPLITLTAETCSMALILTVLFEEADLKNIIQFTASNPATPKSFMLSSLVFLNFVGILNAATLYIAPLPLLLNCDADTFKFIRSQPLVFSETTTAAATTAKEPAESSGSAEIV
ncbi:hypothetical protein WN943_022956 [Citrus x changshan-huyou]